MVVGLDIKAVVEVESGAIAVEFGAQAAAVAQDKIDATPAREHRAGNGRRGNASRPALFSPFDLRARARSNGYSHDELVPHRHALDEPVPRRGVGSGKAGQCGQQGQQIDENHCGNTISSSASQGRFEPPMNCAGTDGKAKRPAMATKRAPSDG